MSYGAGESASDSCATHRKYSANSGAEMRGQLKARVPWPTVERAFSVNRPDPLKILQSALVLLRMAANQCQLFVELVAACAGSNAVTATAPASPAISGLNSASQSPVMTRLRIYTWPVCARTPNQKRPKQAEKSPALKKTHAILSVETSIFAMCVPEGIPIRH